MKSSHEPGKLVFAEVIYENGAFYGKVGLVRFIRYKTDIID